MARIFEDTIETDPGERSLTGTVRRRIMQTVESPDMYPPGALKDAVSQLGILSKRKYSYGLLYQYFSEALNQGTELYQSQLERFIKMWSTLAYLAIRTSMPGRTGEIGLLVDKVEQPAQDGATAEGGIDRCLSPLETSICMLSTDPGWAASTAIPPVERTGD